jgi:hypothetical protein
MRNLTILAAVAACAVASPAAAQVTGPVYPAPGGTTFSTNGQSQYQSGRVATYTGFDLSQTGDLYFGLTSHGLAMDGAIDEAGENLMFDSVSSNIAGGQAIYAGFTNVVGSTATIGTRLVLTFTDLAGNPLALTLDPTITATADPSFFGPLLNVTGDFRMTGGFEAYNGSAWVSAGPFYDAYPMKPAGAQGIRGSLGGGFYSTPNATAAVPEPATWAMMLLGFGGVGFQMRRQRRKGSFLTQAA